jgi:hypothetical protein
LLILIFAVPAAVFSLTVGFFTLFGLAIFSLRFALVFKFRCPAALIATIGMSSPAASANAKTQIAPSTLN